MGMGNAYMRTRPSDVELSAGRSNYKAQLEVEGWAHHMGMPKWPYLGNSLPYACQTLHLRAQMRQSHVISLPKLLQLDQKITNAAIFLTQTLHAEEKVLGTPEIFIFPSNRFAAVL